MAEIALNVVAFAFVVGVFYAVRIAMIARRRKTRWRIYLAQPQNESSVRVQWVILWDTDLPDDVAVHHIPTPGSKWGDATVQRIHLETLP